MAHKDYYQILGITITASVEEVKSAYRRLAREYHPDANGGDRDKEALFHEISQAYDVLGDDTRRAVYDAFHRPPPTSPPATEGRGRPAPTAGEGRGRPSGPTVQRGRPPTANPGFGGGFGGGARPVRMRGRVELTLAEAVLGADKTLTLEMPDGQEREVTLHVPPGTEDGETIRLPNPGGRSPALELVLEIKVQPSPQFRRHGLDLEVDVPVPFEKAVLGGPIQVPTLAGTTTVALPAGSSSGHRLFLAGQGAADRKGKRGDLHGVVMITVPRRLSDEARQLIERYARLSG